MDLRLVEIFCAVYEERSFSRAADRLRLSQPTISGHVKALEDYFGAALFDRLGRSIEPTRAGVLLYQYGRRIAAASREAQQEMDRLLHRHEGQLRLGASTLPGEYLLPPLFGQFRETRPGIRVTLTVSDTREIVDRVTRGELELGVVGAMVVASDLEFSPFASDEIILVTPATPAWEDVSDSISLVDLKERPLVMREHGSGTRMALEDNLRQHGLSVASFDVVVELGSTAALKHAVQAGVGGAFLSSLAVRAEVEAGWMRRVRVPEIEPLPRSFFRVLHRRRTRSPLAEAFLEFLDRRSEPRS